MVASGAGGSGRVDTVLSGILMIFCPFDEQRMDMRKAKTMTLEARAAQAGIARPPRPRRVVSRDPFRRGDFLVVGLGASAGGLEALYKLFDALPPDTGMAFVLIQHLDPTHSSMMPE